MKPNIFSRICFFFIFLPFPSPRRPNPSSSNHSAPWIQKSYLFIKDRQSEWGTVTESKGNEVFKTKGFTEWSYYLRIQISNTTTMFVLNFPFRCLDLRTYRIPYIRCCCNHVYLRAWIQGVSLYPWRGHGNMKPWTGLLLGLTASTVCNGSVAFLQQQSRLGILGESAGLFKSSSSTAITTTVAISAWKVMGQRVPINSWDHRWA